MSLSAIDSVDDAVAATKRFLVPFDRIRWFRLAVIMLFITGAGLSFPGVPFGDGAGTGSPDGEPGEPAPGQPAPGELTPELTTELLVLIVGVVLFGVAVALLWMTVSAVMEFVFVESLGREEVRLRSYFRRHWWRGVRLFAFRLVVWLLTAGGLAGALLGTGVVFGGWPPGGWGDETALAVILLAIPVVLLTAVVVGILLGFTTMFVVPVMLTEERGVLSAWRRFGSTLRASWKEYLAYLFVNFALGIFVGIASGFLLLGVALVVVIPTLLVAIPTWYVVGLNAIGGTILLVLFLVAALLFFVAALLVRVPFQTFLRYYALLVLGDTNDDFDVIPTTRAAVRADGGEADGAAPGTGETSAGGTGDGADGSGEPTSDRPGDWTPGDDGVSDSDDGWNVDRNDGWDRTDRDDDRDDTTSDR